MMQVKLWMLLKQNHISQVELAERLGISEKTVSLKLQGKADFWWSEVESICELLQLGNPMEVFTAVRRDAWR